MSKRKTRSLWPDYEEANAAICDTPYTTDPYSPAHVGGVSKYGLSSQRLPTLPNLPARCSHLGETILFTDPHSGITLGGAAGASVSGYSCGLVIDCGGLYSHGPSRPTFVKDAAFNVDFPTAVAEAFRGLNAHVRVKAPCFPLDWPDRSIPPTGRAFWAGLWHILRTYYAGQHIIVCCVGGHGRTGTALGALMATSGPPLTGATIIETIRTKHCTEAIETVGQEEYIHRLAREGSQPPR